MKPVGKIGIPAARAHLHEIANQVEAGMLTAREAADWIRWLIPHLVRNPCVRRAPVQSRRVEPWLAHLLRAELARNPDTPMQVIAERHGTNMGRVSEAAHNLR